jgi:CRISPR-associated protein Cas1
LAAQYYWKALFGKDFVRDQNADGINAVLNYGYSIIRATIARSFKFNIFTN